MNRYVRIVVANAVLVVGALVAGSGIFGAASNPDEGLTGLLMALFGVAAVSTGVWIGIGGQEDGEGFGDSAGSGRGRYLLIACVAGFLALVSLGYFFTEIGDSTRPEQSGGFGFMPIGLLGMVVFGSASVLFTIAWLGARRN